MSDLFFSMKGVYYVGFFFGVFEEKLMYVKIELEVFMNFYFEVWSVGVVFESIGV